jgi:hypothetical protein
MHLGETGLDLINVGQDRNQLLYSEYSNECLGYIKKEVLDQLNNYYPLKYDSVPLSCNQHPDCLLDHVTTSPYSWSQYLYRSDTWM